MYVRDGEDRKCWGCGATREREGLYVVVTVRLRIGVYITVR